MGHVLLWHLDGRLPNLALMRIAAHHRALGDTVELRRGTPSRLLWDRPTHVYGSLLFTRSRPLAEQLRAFYPDAVLGGTGWDATRTLGQVGIPETGPLDYTVYPDYPHSLGYTQRGCRLHCPFCVVPRKEGRVQPVATMAEIWRGAPWPKTILLLDNDVFGQPHWAERLEEIRTGQFRVCFTQGINVRLLTEEAAQALARVHFMDDQFRRRRLYTAWDNRRDEARLFAGLERLVRHGVPPDAIMVYLLIGYWPGETEADWLYRQARLRAFGARPYPMPYVRTPVTVGFQRWCVGAYDKRIPWAQWQAAGYRPERVYARQENGRARDQTALPLWQGRLAAHAAPEADAVGAGETTQMPSELRRDAWYGCYAQSLRTLLVPAVPAHPAKMPWGLALRLIAHVKAEGWLPPGGVVLDPLAGTGVTGLACSMCGVRSVLGELEAHFLAALSATVARYCARWQALGSPVPLVLRHDARHLPLHQVEVIISSPPYPGMVHARNHIDPQQLLVTYTGRSSQARAGGYGTHPAQIGVLRPTAYWKAMAQVYRQCYAVLPAGGHLVLVVKGMIRQRRYVDVPAQTAALLEEAGFVVHHWHQAMLTAREAQLTLDGREERQRHLSFFRRVHARRNAGVFIDHEVVLCAEKPRAVSSRP